jgi:4-diphosphocytidyl-2-C-methyl-D-erythritol kinase
MSSILIAAPAKLNLHLEILGRRADGFHALETVFQTVALHDRVGVAVVPGSGIVLTCDDPSLPSDARNLAWKAAAAFLEGREDRRVEIRLEKMIPHGAGLGGGSSDAAAVLRALARLLPGWHDATSLATLAARLGSDVPFFLVGGTALGHGRGEELVALPDLPVQDVTILMPSASVATPAAFAALTETERGPRAASPAAWWQERLSGGDVAGLLHNRLTGPARRLCPEVGALLDYLAGCGVPYLMSGSGAACFALGQVMAPAGVRAWRTTFRRRGDLDDIG